MGIIIIIGVVLLIYLSTSGGIGAYIPPASEPYIEPVAPVYTASPVEKAPDMIPAPVFADDIIPVKPVSTFYNELLIEV